MLVILRITCSFYEQGLLVRLTISAVVAPIAEVLLAVVADKLLKLRVPIEEVAKP